MIYTDYHVHTKYSPDSNAKIIDYIKIGKELGLEYLIFTDHVDFGSNDPDFSGIIDYDEYKKVMKALEDKYEIPIKIGVEIGYERNYKDEIKEFLDKYKFDFIISSIHNGNDLDFYAGDFFTGKSKYDAYLEYFNLLLEMVENFTNYDVVGHLDFIIRYGPYEDKDYKYSDYKDIIDKILKAIIRNKRGIEVNTSGLRGGLNTTFPKNEVILRYKELGGQIITVGSDSHFTKDYRADFNQVISNLKSMGFDNINKIR